MMMACSSRFCVMSSFFSSTCRSARTVQQMQPFIISTISSWDCSLLRSSMREPSTSTALGRGGGKREVLRKQRGEEEKGRSTDPNSFSITANLRPFLFARILFKSVVFPEPRYPVSMVTGTPFDFAERRLAAIAKSCERGGSWRWRERDPVRRG